jgi:hypothetical protein
MHVHYRDDFSVSYVIPNNGCNITAVPSYIVANSVTVALKRDYSASKNLCLLGAVSSTRCPVRYDTT